MEEINRSEHEKLMQEGIMDKLPHVPMDEPVEQPYETTAIAVSDEIYEDPNASIVQRAVWSAEPPKPSEMQMPYFRLMQALSEDVKNGLANPGEFRVDGYPELEHPLRLIPLMRAITRTYRSSQPSPMGEFEVFCESVDAITGMGDPGGNCSTCPKAAWGENRMPPECTEAYRYTCYLPSIDMPVVWNLQKSGVSCARRIDQFAMRGWGSFAIECQSISKRGMRGDYFVPTVTKQPLTDDERTAVSELANWMRG